MGTTRISIRMRALRRLVPAVLGSLVTVILVTLLNSLSSYQEHEQWRKNPLDNGNLHNPINTQNGAKLNFETELASNADRKLQRTVGDDEPPNRAKVDKTVRLEKLKAARSDKRKTIEDTENRWRKDDEALVPIEPIDGELPEKPSGYNPEIVALKEEFRADAFPEPDEACSNNTTLQEYHYKKHSKTWPKDDSWDLFFAQIGNCDLYRENSEIVENLLADLATMPIKSIANLDGGTQVKIKITFKNGKKAVFKPMRFGRLYETEPNQFYFTDFERHHAEIAAFHLDRLLGFRRAIPTVGRVLNISSDLHEKAQGDVIKFFVSPAKNRCFVGKCDYYCDTTHAICGQPDLKEGSVQVWLPGDDVAQRDYWRSPYKRTYSKRDLLAPWQVDPTFCTWRVKNAPPFLRGRRLLDIVDLYIFDFLTGNQDRHHYESFTFFDPVPHLSYIVHLDNGRAFGRPDFDDMDILAPLTQCCVVRPSTVKTLMKYYFGPTSLARALKDSLKRDPTYPVLARKYLIAVDRRVEIILKEVAKCIRKANGELKRVLMNHYHNPTPPPNAKEFEDSDSNE